MLFIIFGAGASYDHDPLSLRAINYPRLPLSNDIINSNLDYTQRAMTKWPGAVPLLNRLSEIKKHDERNFNLEDALYKELQRNNEYVKFQLLSFLFYVHDIIRNSELQVRTRNQGNTNYTRLLDILQQNNTDQKMGIALITFNYDTLIETACSQLYPTWEFNNFGDYITGSSIVRLYKPHGSLSWKKIYNNIPHIPYQLGTIKGLSSPDSFGIFDKTQQISSYYFEHTEHIIGGSTITEPILALPYKEKTSFVFPNDHKTALLKDISQVTHILTIGWRGNENHFQKEFISKIPNGRQIKVLNVNKGGRDIINNLQVSLGNKISSMSLHDEGFSAFLNNKIFLEKFLS